MGGVGKLFFLHIELGKYQNERSRLEADRMLRHVSKIKERGVQSVVDVRCTDVVVWSTALV